MSPSVIFDKRNKPETLNRDGGSPFSLMKFLTGTLVLVGVSLVIYVPTLNYEMIFDDVLSIEQNESIHQLFPLFGSNGESGPLNPSQNTPLTARPVVNLSFAINHHFGGFDPAGYRAANIAMHVVIGLLLWYIVRITLTHKGFPDVVRRNHSTLGLISAIAWGVHPANTETVVYLTQRTELMMGLFYLLSFASCIRYWSSRRVGKAFWWVMAVAFSVLGMLSKEMMASIPAMVLLYEWIFIEHQHDESEPTIWNRLTTLARRSWPLYLGYALSYLPLVWMYNAGYKTPIPDNNQMPPLVCWWMTQSEAFFVYWKLFFWPWPLLIHYDIPIVTQLSDCWQSVIGITVYLSATAWLLFHRRPMGFVLIWFFAVLSPTLIVPLPMEEIVERRMYVPIIASTPALIVAIFIGCVSLHKRFLPALAPKHDGSGSPVAMMVLIVICLIASVVSYATTPRMKSRDTIWLEVLKHRPDDVFACMNQGSVEINNGNEQKGLQLMESAFERKPTSFYNVRMIADALFKLGQEQRLLEVYETAIEHHSNKTLVTYNLANLLDKRGDPGRAIELYRRTIEVDPKFHAAHTNLALLLADQGKLNESEKHFTLAAGLNPDFANQMNLMNIYLQTGQIKKAKHVTPRLLQAAKDEGRSEVARRIEHAIGQLEVVVD